MLDSRNKTSLRRKLLNWFDKNQRDLPWRRNKNRYRIWVSEIMLQQTQVATVIDYYKRFMKRFPTVRKLAAADQSEVLKLWEGLGYYRRARQMHSAAQVVVEQHRGRFPDQFEDVFALPGIGRYTAGAILSIADDQSLPILEGNTIRLFARLMEMRKDPRATDSQKRLWEFSESLVPRKRAGDFNQALMELGSLICRPKSPDCDQCPIRNLCPTFVKGLQQQIPAAGKKLKYEELHEAVIVLKRRGKYLVRMCGESERWTGLWDFPRYETKQTDSEKIVEQPAKALERKLKTSTGFTAKLLPTSVKIKHAVTRFRITLDCYVGDNVTGRIKKSEAATTDAKDSGPTNVEFKWVSASELAELPMSVTGRKIAGKVEALTRS